MGEYRRLALLVLIMTGVCLIVGATAIGMLYQAAFDRESARLVNIVQSQARLMETMRRFDLEHAKRTGDPVPDTLAQVIAAHRVLRQQTVGKTGEITLARREGDIIVWLSRTRGEELHAPQALPFNSPLAEPMRAALSGRSGTMVDLDYAGRRVLAAFEPVALLNLGLVAKIETAEINQRYLRAGAIAGLVSLLLVVGASFLFYHVSEPMIRRIRESESRFRELFENMGSGVAVYEAVAGGTDFVFKDLNRAGEHSEHLRRQDVIGKRITEIYPKIREFGLVDVFQRVWRTGKAESLPARLYRDDRRDDWWRENYVYKLPGGEVVALFDDVSERIRAEQALRQSEARYRTLVEEQPDLICQFLPDTTLTFVNRAYAAFYGREPHELMGRRWLDFVAKDERPRFLDELSTFTPEHPERHEETRSTGADGRVHWYLCHFHAFFDDAGQVLSFQTFATDITERKRAEEGLAESERRTREQLLELETLYRTAPIGLLLLDRELRFLRINETLAKINGPSVEEHLGKIAWDVVPDLKEAAEPLFRQVLATGEPLTGIELHGETPQQPGVQRDWIEQFYPLKGPDGEVVAVGAIIQEVTEQKRAERALQEAVAQYKVMGEAVPYGVWLCGPDGGARYVSQSFLELLDMSMEEMQQFGWTKRLPAEDVEPTLQRWLGCVRTGEPWDSEHRFIGPNGEIRNVLTRGRPVRDSDGTITSWAGINLDITEREHAEQALRESEARYRTAGEAIRYGVWVCNSKGGVEFVSQIFLDLIGKTLDEVKPRGWLDRLPPEDLKPTLNAWHECVRTGAEWTWEHRVKGKDDVWRTILSLGRPVRNEWDRITSWVGFNLDITERKEAEDALRESEARFRGTFENAAVGIANVAKDGTWLRVNQRLCEILGYSRTELLQKNFQEMTHSEDLPFNLDRFTALMRGEIDTYQLEKRYLHKDGHAVWVDLTAAVQRDQAGNPAYCIAIIEDIGARKGAERALRESEIRMRVLLDASQDEILLLSTQGEVLAINKAAERRLARRTGGVDPVGAHLDRLLPEDQVEQRITFVRQVAATATFLHWETQIRSRWFEFWFYPVLQPGRPVSEVAVYAREITERKEMEAQLRHSQKMQVVGQLTGGIAHDFNNLLAIIMGNLQLLEMRVSGDPKARQYLDDALWSARRGGDLTHRLLAFARKQPLKPAVIDLNDVVNGMTELLRRTLGAGIRIEESLAPDLWKAHADRGELERGLVNLAVNSRDAMRSAGTLIVETRNAVLDEDYAEQHEEVTPGEYVLLAVTDTGTGMPPEIVQRVFEPFFTTKEVGKGSGLGLSMVYGFAKQSGGHISIYSRVGHGTSVKLYLPRALSSPAQLEDGAPDMSPEEFGEKVVLVVEDEAKLRKVAVKMLERLGLRSLQAETAKDALNLLAGTRVDVLFTDIELPGGMNGIELAKAAHELDPNIKVLFTTGYVRETSLHEWDVHERASLLLKPYSHQELARELKALLVPTMH